MSDLLRSFRFALHSLDGLSIPAAAITVIPNGRLTGPGQVIVRAALKQNLADFLSRRGSQDVMLDLFDDAHFPTPARVMHLQGLCPAQAVVSPIKLDATTDDILILEAAMPYESLQIGGPAPLQQLAAQA